MDQSCWVRSYCTDFNYDLRALKKGKAEDGVEYSTMIQQERTAQSMEHMKWTYSDRAEEVKRKKKFQGEKNRNSFENLRWPLIEIVLKSTKPSPDFCYLSLVHSGSQGRDSKKWGVIGSA